MSERAGTGTPDASELLSMAQVVRETGLSEHTLRAWERRYDAVRPMRSGGGSRRYSAADLRRLRLLRRAVDAGLRIGEASRMDSRELEALLATHRANVSPRVSGLLARVGVVDEGSLSVSLHDALDADTPRAFVLEVALPLLREMGDAWEAGTLPIAAEHLASEALRNVLHEALRRARSANAQAAATAKRRVVFAVPQGERHELASLAAAVVGASAGADVVFLGGDLPSEEVARVAQERCATDVCIGAIVASPRQCEQTMLELAEACPAGTRLWLGGGASAGTTARAEYEILDSLEALERALRRA